MRRMQHACMQNVFQPSYLYKMDSASQSYTAPSYTCIHTNIQSLLPSTPVPPTFLTPIGLSIKWLRRWFSHGRGGGDDDWPAESHMSRQRGMSI
mmetsp:Transcript_28212/g.45700  ORF Transcript_28212/g.45700 Transcript_28212/m.45700 type:complete len:94 (+) Transcript_28212:74-355(+)